MRSTTIPVLVLALFASGLIAQTQRAQLQGLVTDPSGAAVPEVTIEVASVTTGAINKTVSGGDGRYAVPFLLPGTYTVNISKQGFRRHAQSNVKLDVGQTLELNVSLEVGDIATSVDVSAEAPPLATADSTVQTSIGTKSITDLPLNGRLVLNLAATVPGVFTGTSAASGQNDNYTPQIGGGRMMTSEAVLDGAPLSVADPTGGARVMGGLPPSPDAVQEFAVQVNGLPAQYGRFGGGVINIATKSGTNELHGTARYFVRNSAFDANNFFSNKNGVKLASFKRNQYGFSAGGPVYLGKVYDGRNRTFFFVDLERTNERTPAQVTTTLPTAEWRQGDFSNLLNFRGVPIAIYDPNTTTSTGPNTWTRDVFPGNKIPRDRMSPVALKILPYYPDPNRPSTNPFQATNNWFNSGTTSVDTSNLTVRADHSWNNSYRSYWRLNRSRYHIAPVQLVGGTPADNSSDNIRPRWNGVWDNTFIVNPTTTVNIRFNVTRWEYDLFPTTMGFDSDTLGFPSYLRQQSAQEWIHFPSIGISGLASRGGGGGLTWKSNSGNLAGSVAKAMGKHNLQAGMEYRKFFLNFFQPQNPNGAFSFSDDWTRRDPFTFSDAQGFGFATFLLGIPSSGNQINVPQQALASSYWGLFVQDDIRVSKKLTLNIGLRWDVDIPRTERYNKMSYYDLAAPSPIAGKVPGFPDLVGTMRFVDNNNRRQTPTVWSQWAPRFGFAYQANTKTVVRGAYGIVYDASPMQVAYHNGGFEGYRLSTPLITTRDGVTPLASLSNPFPNGFLAPSRNADVDLGFTVSESWFPFWDSPRIQEWNLNVQRELPGKMTVEVGYIGNKGTHVQNGDNPPYDQLDSKYMSLGNQLRQQVANPFYGEITDSRSALSLPTVEYGQLLRPYPQLSGLTLNWRPNSNSIYHGMTVRVERRFANGLSLLAAFTGGKLISDAEASGFFSSANGSAPQDTYNRRAERAVYADDIARRFVLSGTYNLPIGKGKRLLGSANRLTDAVLGGWQTNGLWTWQTGMPIVILQPTNQAGIYNARQRPTSNGQPATYTSGSMQDRLTRWFDPSVFSITPPYQFGTAARTLTSVRHPGVNNMDVSLFKIFAILAEHRLDAQLRLEAFNVMNHAQFGRVNSTIGSTSTGNITSTAVNPRQLQLGLKFVF